GDGVLLRMGAEPQPLVLERGKGQPAPGAGHGAGVPAGVPPRQGAQRQPARSRVHGGPGTAGGGPQGPGLDLAAPCLEPAPAAGAAAPALPAKINPRGGSGETGPADPNAPGPTLSCDPLITWRKRCSPLAAILPRLSCPPCPSADGR